jgi:TonB family protein
MGYRALLFCPDEKTARTVTQVFTELEFTVEACSEPFAAVKKLMGEHFDAIAVDCENEQNATLLFKSARQSTSNQASLAVAVVDGQAGVAKAFRIGANLVLTKPINVEQAKGTLRVARGLLRKGEPAKPMRAETASPSPASASISPRPVKAASAGARSTSTASSVAPQGRTQSPMPASMPTPWGDRMHNAGTPAANISAEDSTSHESDAEEIFIEDESPSLEEATPPVRTAAPSAAFSAMRQMTQKTPAPLNSGSSSSRSLSSGASSSGASSSGVVSSRSSSSGSSSFSASGASAVAPARIPQPAKPAEPLLSKIARTLPAIDDPTETVESETSAMGDSISDISLASDEVRLAQTKSQAKAPAKIQSKPTTTGSKKILLGVLAAVLLVAALCFAWMQMHGQIKLPSALSHLVSQVTGTKPQTPSASSLPPAPGSVLNVIPAAASSTDPQSNLPAVQQAGQDTAQPDTSNNASGSANNLPVSANKVSNSASSVKIARPLVVKNGNTALKHSAADTAAPSVFLSADGAGGSVPNLIVTSAKVTTPMLQTLSVSQGTTQGLVIKKVQPIYPNTALRMRLEGQVQLLATIAKSGKVMAVKTVSGEPLLAQAASDAVRQWKYKPYTLSGEPTEIQTQITINFKLPE